MNIRTRFLAGAVFTAAIALAAPAAANIPVIDPTAIAKIRETVSVATKQLGAIQQQVQQVQQMRNTIGQVGPGMLGSILQNSGLNFSGDASILHDITSMGGQVNGMLSQAGSLGIGKEGSLSLPSSIQNLSDGRTVAQKLFFYNGSDTIDQTTIAQLRERRSTMLRNSAINGYGTATSMKSDMTKSAEIADKLSAQAQSAADLRGDVQANTAALLAIYSEITKQTALQAQQLEVQSAQTLSVDPTAQVAGK